MAKFIQKPKGTRDVLPDSVYKWNYIENILTQKAKIHGFSEIRFPTFEHTDLFIRSVGDTTDVVQKEMYTFMDKGNRYLSLRPEGTASVVRSFLENSIYSGMLPFKVFYIAPNFRYENVESGRLREHHQFGVECFGPAEAMADFEVISIAHSFLTELLIDCELHINSIGCPSCRPSYNNILHSFLSTKELCATCVSRLSKNPIRILDCKNESCQKIVESAPRMINSLCNECSEHFDKVKLYLDNMGIKYTVNTSIVRGLDYYTKTVFEFVSDIGTICGGGRYDSLVESLGGPSTPAVGFGCGEERLIMAMESMNLGFGSSKKIDVYIGNIGDDSILISQTITSALRNMGFYVCMDIMGRGIKAQMKYADRIGARFSLIIGSDEILNGSAKLRNMSTGDEISTLLEAGSIAKFLMNGE